MKSASSRQELRLGGRRVRVSNLDKVFYPEAGFTKGDVIEYYARVAPVLLKYLKERALTLKRYPDGVEEGFFYEKQCPSHAPQWIKTTPVKKSDGSTIRYCLLNDLPSLIWAANLANLELHPFLHRASAPRRPDGVMFDLDPGPPANVVECCEVALYLRGLITTLGLDVFPKTSGSKGLQLMIPLNGSATYQRTKPFAKAVAEVLARRFPKLVVAEMKKSLRRGRVFIDWSQNDSKKTTVSPYSLRATGQPTVSTPLKWEEVEAALKHREADRLRFTSAQVVERLEQFGDLYAPVLSLEQTLPQLPAAE